MLDVGFWSIFNSFIIMAFCPLLVIYFWLACDSYQCSLVAPAQELLARGLTKESILSFVAAKFPKPTEGKPAQSIEVRSNLPRRIQTLFRLVALPRHLIQILAWKDWLRSSHSCWPHSALYREWSSGLDRHPWSFYWTIARPRILPSLDYSR